MDPITVTTIRSTLTTNCTIQDSHNNLIEIAPGQEIQVDLNLHLTVVDGVEQIDSTIYHAFNVDGDERTKAFAVVNGTGLISALGTETEDFAPEDPCMVKITIPEATTGQNVFLTLREDFKEKERIVWVIGDIDDVL